MSSASLFTQVTGLEQLSARASSAESKNVCQVGVQGALDEHYSKRRRGDRNCVGCVALTFSTWACSRRVPLIRLTPQGKFGAVCVLGDRLLIHL